MYYVAFAVTVCTSTLFHIVIFLTRSLGAANNNRTFSQVKEELWDSCNGFVVTSILITTFSLVQMIAIWAPVAMLIRLSWLKQQIFPVREGILPVVTLKKFAAVAVYFVSFAAIVLVEVLTQDTISVAWDDDGVPWGFGQILAMASLLAPLLALFDYAINRSPKLNGSRPVSPRYLMWRTCPWFDVLLLILLGSLYFIANLNLWPVFWWLVLFFVPFDFTENFGFTLGTLCLSFVLFWWNIVGRLTLRALGSPITLTPGEFIEHFDPSPLFRGSATNWERYKSAFILLFKNNLDGPLKPVQVEPRLEKVDSLGWLLRFLLLWPALSGPSMHIILIFWMYVMPASKLAGLSVLGAWFLGSVMLYWRVPDKYLAATLRPHDATNTGIIPLLKMQ